MNDYFFSAHELIYDMLPNYNTAINGSMPRIGAKCFLLKRSDVYLKIGCCGSPLIYEVYNKYTDRLIAAVEKKEIEEIEKKFSEFK